MGFETKEKLKKGEHNETEDVELRVVIAEGAVNATAGQGNLTIATCSTANTTCIIIL